jgi:hypothetical protein
MRASGLKHTDAISSQGSEKSDGSGGEMSTISPPSMLKEFTKRNTANKMAAFWKVTGLFIAHVSSVMVLSLRLMDRVGMRAIL